MKRFRPTRPALLAALAFAFIFAGAIAVRFWNLGGQPGGLYPDEAAEGLSALRILHEPGYHPVFIDENEGREALFAYLVALAFKLFGASVLVLRATAAAIGVAGVAATWLAVRRYGRWPAIGAMAWSAGSLWLICISRDGFRNIITVPFAALAFAAILWWNDRPSRKSAFMAGLACGAGLWTYQPLRLTPLIVIVWAVWLRKKNQTHYRQILAGAWWAVLGYVMVGLPMFWTAVTDWRNYFNRIVVVSVFNPRSDAHDMYLVHVLKTLGMFLVTGDPNARHDVNALPLLGPIIFVPFLLGLWRAWRLRGDAGHVLLLVAFIVYFIPPMVADEGDSPHFLRSIAMAPFVAGLIGIGLLEMHSIVLRLLWRARGLRRRFAHAVIPLTASLMLCAVGFASINTYLARPQDQTMYDAYKYADVRLAQEVNQGGRAAIIIGQYDAQDIRFLDWGNEPDIFSPGTKLQDPKQYSVIVAVYVSDLARATTPEFAARAKPVALDPLGRAVGWEISP